MDWRMPYTLMSLLRDLIRADAPRPRDPNGRPIWGSDPDDFGEGLAFSYAGESLFEPGRPTGDEFPPLPDLSGDLRLIGGAIDRAVAACVEGRM